jgi:hypothetical protein
MQNDGIYSTSKPIAIVCACQTCANLVDNVCLIHKKNVQLSYICYSWFPRMSELEKSIKCTAFRRV